jgi:hypothetical protein
MKIRESLNHFWKEIKQFGEAMDYSATWAYRYRLLPLGGIAVFAVGAVIFVKSHSPAK